jgi:hypothetical protein
MKRHSKFKNKEILMMIPVVLLRCASWKYFFNSKQETKDQNTTKYHMTFKFTHLVEAIESRDSEKPMSIKFEERKVKKEKRETNGAVGILTEILRVFEEIWNFFK